MIDNESSTLLAKINEKLSIEKRRIVLKLLMNWQRSLKVTHEMISNDANSQCVTLITTIIPTSFRTHTFYINLEN